MLEINSIDSYTSSKIVKFEEASKLIAKIKSSGKTLGICHGGFDLLHAGHIIHFESAKKLCDVLIVSITADKFIVQRKGSGRPIFPEKIRAYMIAAIECVDYAVISDFNTGVEVIETLKPNFYIKGPDYIDDTRDEINAEREAIKNVDGEIKYTDDMKLSTTNTIEYIKKELNKNK